jgi:IS1 family transposase
LLQQQQPDDQIVMIVRVDVAEIAEIWNFGQSKQQQRWLDEQQHTIGKISTQRIERKHLTLRTLT